MAVVRSTKVSELYNNLEMNVIYWSKNPVEIYNHELVLERAKRNEIGYAFETYDDKTLNDYKGNVMDTAPYSMDR